MIITNSRCALVGYFITSYPTRAHGIIVTYLNFACETNKVDRRQSYRVGNFHFFNFFFINFIRLSYHKLQICNKNKQTTIELTVECRLCCSRGSIRYKDYFGHYLCRYHYDLEIIFSRMIVDEGTARVNYHA